MGLPTVKINIATGGLGRAGDGVQKIAGLIITGATVADGIAIGESRQIFSLADAEGLGILEAGANAFAHKHIAAYYAMAGSGSELWLMLVSDATTYADMADVNETIGMKLIADAGGRIRVLGLLKEAGSGETITEGIDADVKAGVANAQALAEYYEDRYMPFRVVISGNKFSGTVAELFDYNTASYNKVLMLLANTDKAPEASIGKLLGRIAAIPTQRSIARVKDGAAEDFSTYFTNGASVETLRDAWDTIHDLGYTFYRNFTGKAGYYFTDDRTLTSATDDFSSLARGLVMDEALILVYNVLVDELNDEIPVTAEGKIHPVIIKSWQSNVNTRLQALMVALGKLSNAACFIDPDQNVLSTDKVMVQVSLQPVGYAKNIDVTLGFTTNISQ